MEYMSKNNLETNNRIKNKDLKNNKTSINDVEDDDDIGENYEDDFSENVSREIKYFNPTQTKAPSSYYFSEEKPRILNRFQKYN